MRGLAMRKYADTGHYGNNSEDTNLENRIKVNKYSHFKYLQTCTGKAQSGPTARYLP